MISIFFYFSEKYTEGLNLKQIKRVSSALSLTYQLTISHETRISFKIQKSLETQLGSTSHTTSEFQLAEERWVGLEMYWAVRVTEH